MSSRKPYPYIGIDSRGFRYNAMYPPTASPLGNYGGYPDNAHQVLLYDFAVQGYDASFKFNGKPYHLLYDDDYAAVCDETFTIEYQRFDNPMTLIKNFRIEGTPLIDLLARLTDAEPM